MWKTALRDNWWYSLQEATDDLPLSQFTFWTDASEVGFGAYLYPEGTWISEAWANCPKWTGELMENISQNPEVTINSLEFLALLIPLYVLVCDDFKINVNNTCCQWMCDNKAAIWWVRNEKAKSPLPALFTFIWNGISRKFRLRQSVMCVLRKTSWLMNYLGVVTSNLGFRLRKK